MAHIVGGGAVAGIGFTVALFIAKLAFVDESGEPLPFQQEAILGILVASLIAATLGGLILRRTASRSARPGAQRQPVPVES